MTATVLRLPRLHEPAATDASPHICTPRDDWGGRCWCQPRSLLTVQLQRSLAATEGKK